MFGEVGWAVLGQSQLLEGSGSSIGLQRKQLPNNGFVGDDVANTERRSNRLGEAPAVDDLTAITIESPQ